MVPSPGRPLSLLMLGRGPKSPSKCAAQAAEGIKPVPFPINSIRGTGACRRPLSLSCYLRLVDASSRMIRAGKTSLEAELAPIFQRLGLDQHALEFYHCGPLRRCGEPPSTDRSASLLYLCGPLWLCGEPPSTDRSASLLYLCGPLCLCGEPPFFHSFLSLPWVPFLWLAHGPTSPAGASGKYWPARAHVGRRTTGSSAGDR